MVLRSIGRAGGGLGWRLAATMMAAAVTGCGDDNGPEELMAVAVFGGGAGNGVVNIAPSGLACTITGGVEGNTCGASVAPGTTVTLTAVAAAGHQFDGWGDDCAATTAPVCTLTVTGPVSIVARFKPVAVAVDHLLLDPFTMLLEPGGARTISAKAYAADGTELPGRALTWLSTNPAVATVDQTGRVTAHTLGVARIQVTTEGKTFASRVDVLPGSAFQLVGKPGGTLPAIIEVTQYVSNGVTRSVKTVLTGGALDFDPVDGGYTQAFQFEVYDGVVAVPEPLYQLVAQGIWTDHGLVEYDFLNQRRVLSSSLFQNHWGVVTETATGVQVTQKVANTEADVTLQFARR